jgi:hypothetical protein
VNRQAQLDSCSVPSRGWDFFSSPTRPDPSIQLVLVEDSFTGAKQLEHKTNIVLRSKMSVALPPYPMYAFRMLYLGTGVINLEATFAT